MVSEKSVFKVYHQKTYMNDALLKTIESSIDKTKDCFERNSIIFLGDGYKKYVKDIIDEIEGCLFSSLLGSLISSIETTRKNQPEKFSEEKKRECFHLLNPWIKKNEKTSIHRNDYEQMKKEVKKNDIKFTDNDVKSLYNFINMIETEVDRPGCEKLIEDFFKWIENTVKDVRPEDFFSLKHDKNGIAIEIRTNKENANGGTKAYKK